MKKGINIWSFKAGMTIAECIAMAKDAGFDGIELSLDEEGELSLNSTEKDVLKIKEMVFSFVDVITHLFRIIQSVIILNHLYFFSEDQKQP